MVERQAFLRELTEGQALALLHSWKFWARPKQLEPSGDWLTWLILAGRGFGKTKTGAETTRSWMCGSTPLSRGRFARMALVAETAADGRDVMVEGDSGIMACHPKEFRPHYEPSKRRLTWPNGAMATIYNGTEPDQLRGPQHDCAWTDELAKFDYARETWDQLQFGLRIGDTPRQIVTTTPRPIPVIRDLLKSKSTLVTLGSTYENRSNLAASFFNEIIGKYEGTRLGRQELNAEVLDDLPGALWLRTYFDPPDGSKLRGRVRWDKCPQMTRIVVGVDPSGTKGGSDDGDSIGIVVAGIDAYDHVYVIADFSVKDGPAGWGREVVAAYTLFEADRIVAEANFGGAMVESTIRAVDNNVPVRMVYASRGKAVRAEPVAALYEQGRVSHVVGANPKDAHGMGLSELEDQMCLMAASGYAGEGSPDRVDAAVWAITELALGEEQAVAMLLTKRHRR